MNTRNAADMKEQRNWFNLAITAFFFVAVAIYFTFNRQALQDLFNSISIVTILTLMLLKFTRILTTGLFTKLALEAFSRKISIRETNYVSIITAAGNFFGPLLGGASVRAVYLKKKYKFQYSKFVSTMYGYYLISFTTYSIIGTLVLWLTYNQHGDLNGTKLVGLFLVTILAAGVTALLLPIKYGLKLASIRLIKPIKKYVVTAAKGWSSMKRHPGLLRNLFILSIVVLCLASLESLVLYRLFSNNIALSSVILYTVLGAFSMLVSITPGAIGIKEGFFLLVSSTLLLDSTQVIQMATIDRSVAFILLVIMLILTKTSFFSADKKMNHEQEGIA